MFKKWRDKRELKKANANKSVEHFSAHQKLFTSRKKYRIAIISTTTITACLISVPFIVYSVYLATRPPLDPYYVETQEVLEQNDYYELASLVQLDQSDIGIDITFSSTSADTFTYDVTKLENAGYEVIDFEPTTNVVEIETNANTGSPITNQMSDTVIFLDVTNKGSVEIIDGSGPLETANEIIWNNVILIPYIENGSEKEIAYSSLTIQNGVGLVPSDSNITVTDSIIIGSFVGYNGRDGVVASTWTFTNSTFFIKTDVEGNKIADQIYIENCSFYSYTGNLGSTSKTIIEEDKGDGYWFMHEPTIIGQYTYTWSYSIADKVFN